MIPVERTLPDTRDEWCRVKYDTARFDGERTSVIICFHNEVCPTSQMTKMFVLGCVISTSNQPRD